MLNNPLIDFENEADSKEEDGNFKSELIFAIHQSLLEPEENHQEAANLMNTEITQQIRNDSKPTLDMFGMENLI